MKSVISRAMMVAFAATSIYSAQASARQPVMHELRPGDSVILDNHVVTCMENIPQGAQTRNSIRNKFEKVKTLVIGPGEAYLVEPEAAVRCHSSTAEVLGLIAEFQCWKKDKGDILPTVSREMITQPVTASEVDNNAYYPPVTKAKEQAFNQICKNMGYEIAWKIYLSIDNGRHELSPTDAIVK